MTLRPARPVTDTRLSDREILALIRANHLKANISGYEAGVNGAVIHWDRAWIDPGFGGTSGPYAKVPITFKGCDSGWNVVSRVYPPERLRKRLARQLKLR